LLVGTSLLIRTLRNLRHADLGFERRNIVLLTVDAMAARYDAASAVTRYERIADRLRAHPGVQHVALSVRAPMEGGEDRSHDGASRGVNVSARNLAICALQSQRNAAIGSTFAARRAGSRIAARYP
jgi:hypothetical protein